MHRLFTAKLRFEASGGGGTSPPQVLASQQRQLPAWGHAVMVVILLVAAAAAVTIMGGPAVHERALHGINDFLLQYAGATLAGSSSLYSPDAVAQIQLENTGVHLIGCPYGRLPFYAALLKPVASLPYLRAYWLFQLFSLLCCGLFAYLFLIKRHQEYLIWLPLFFPAVINLLAGQDVMIVALFCAMFLVLEDQGRELEAAACLSVCLIKFHLFLFVPLAIIAHRRWRILFGGVAASAFWLAMSFAVQGAHWPIDYLSALMNPNMHMATDKMPSIFWALRSFDLPTPAAALVVIGFGFLFAMAIFRAKDFETSVGLALIAGIVLSVHVYIHDCTMLFLSIPVLAGRSILGLSLRAALLTPLPYFAAYCGKPWNIVLPSLLVVFAAVAVFDRSARFQRAVSALLPRQLIPRLMKNAG